MHRRAEWGKIYKQWVKSVEERIEIVPFLNKVEKLSRLQRGESVLGRTV